MSKYYDMIVYFKKDIKDSFSCLHYPCITKDILTAKEKEFEAKYRSGFYKALKIEYTIIQ